MKESEQTQVRNKKSGEDTIRTVIISGGMIEREHALSVLKSMPFTYVIGADKGLAFLYQEGIEPTHIVGDFDSLEQGILEHYMGNANIKIRIFNPIKDSTDTEIAVRLAMELGSKEILILGGNGVRVDHTLANIQTMAIPAAAGIRCSMEDAHNRITILTGDVTMTREEIFGKYLSFFPLGGTIEDLSLSGVKYPLSHHRMTPFNSLGVSNEATENTVRIEFQKGMLVMVQTCD